MSLQRYPEYRDSGINWLPTVPSHWDVCALKRVASLKSGDSITSEQISEVGDYAVYGGNGLRGFTSSFTHNGRYAIVGRQGALCGNVNYAQGRFWASEHALVATPIKPVETTYLGELLRAMNLNQYSVSAAQPGLSAELISNIGVPYPPLNEQAAIATYLDRETAKIDALIAEQEKLIALLAEKRQATISHAVTRGLNPDAPMKDSGVPWLGEVPAHWAVKSLGRIAIDRCDGPFGSGIKSEHYTDEGALVIRLQNIRAGAFNVGEPVYLDENYFRRELQGHAVVADDLLVAGLGDDNNLLGRACVAPPDLGPALVKADCFRFRLDPDVALPAFVAMQLCAGAAFDAGVLATGTTRSRIPLGVMATRKLVLPPVAEQRLIANFVSMESRKLDALSSEAVRAIGLLKERRSALIAAAVTGQIDVRSVAPTWEEA